MSACVAFHFPDDGIVVDASYVYAASFHTNGLDGVNGLACYQEYDFNSTLDTQSQISPASMYYSPVLCTTQHVASVHKVGAWKRQHPHRGHGKSRHDSGSTRSSKDDHGAQNRELPFCSKTRPASRENEEKARNLEKLLEDDQIEGARAVLEESALSLSFESEPGSRAVQSAIDYFGDKALWLALLFQGHVCAAVESEHANHVIQKIVQVFRPQQVEFVAHEIHDIVEDVARHRYGCRILQRLVEHPNDASRILVEKVLPDVKDLSLHKFGCFVVSALIEHADIKQQKKLIADSVSNNLDAFIENRYARTVLLNVLQLGMAEDRSRVAQEIMSNPHRVAAIAKGKNGKSLIPEVLKCNPSRVWKDYVQCQMTQVLVSQELQSAVGTDAKKIKKNVKDTFQAAQFPTELAPHFN